MFARSATDRTPGGKLMLAVLAALALMVPLFAVFLLIYDRQSQSQVAEASIAQGWGGPQSIAGPVLVIPYWETTEERVVAGGKPETRTATTWRQLTLAPDTASLSTRLDPQRRQRSIYDVVVFQARTQGTASFALPNDLARLDVAADHLALDRAELRFGIGDSRGLSGPPPSVVVAGKKLALRPGKGTASTGGSGFHAFVDARSLLTQPMTVTFDHWLRGTGSLTLRPQAGDTRWAVRSPWQDPSFQGGFLPVAHHEGADGFSATWRIGNLALGSSLVTTGDGTSESRTGLDESGTSARIDLVTPVDLYARVNRAVKYGFLFIGFTFTALLLFDVVGGARVSSIEYLLVGAGLVLFFVMLLAFAEVIGFTAAYALAAGAIITLLAAYSASVLRSRRRGAMIAVLLGGLYAVLYVLISLEAYSLLIGSVLLFAALAAVMYMTRHLDWGGRGAGVEAG